MMPYNASTTCVAVWKKLQEIWIFLCGKSLSELWDPEIQNAVSTFFHWLKNNNLRTLNTIRNIILISVDPKFHKVGEYYTICEKERNEVMNELFWGDFENVTVLLSHKVKCSPDGEYETLANFSTAFD